MNRTLLEREVRVAFSFNAQPLWFRVTKWIIFLGVATWFHQTRPRATFWNWTAGVPLAGLVMHMVYRWRTRGWTQPWAG